jgi:hypothetical protein
MEALLEDQPIVVPETVFPTGVRDTPVSALVLPFRTNGADGVTSTYPLGDGIAALTYTTNEKVATFGSTVKSHVLALEVSLFDKMPSPPSATPEY